MMPHYASEDEAKSIALRLLIHYFGDVHEPLHCATNVDAANPKGDYGGNEFPLKYHYTVDNLHALWDSVMYEYHDSITLPFTSTTWDSFGTTASTLSSS